MGLITDVERAKEIYALAAEKRVCIAAFNTENTLTTHAAMEAAKQICEELGISHPPITISFTASYKPRSNLRNYTSLGDMHEGFLALKADLERLGRRDGPYGEVEILAHLDHGDPDNDSEVIEWGKGFLTGLMFDGSALALDENMRRTAEFVKREGFRFLVEGAVDEIYEADEEKTKNELTSPQDANRFVEKTGVPFIVCNLGTEHRATTTKVEYHGDRAREISALVGPRLVLHGTSSLKPGDLERLAGDGIIKVNIWTVIEKTGGQAIARDTIARLAEILPLPDLRALASEGVLSESFVAACKAQKLPVHGLTHTHRRDVLWMPAVIEKMKDFMNALGYGRLAEPRG